MLMPLFQWFDNTAVAVWIRASTWMFAFIEVFHLLGLTLLLGTVVLVDLRLFGVGLRKQSLADVASDALPWMLAGLLLTMTSGFLLFVSEAMKCYGSPPFFVKMGLLFTAIVFTFTLHRSLTRRKDSIAPTLRSKLAASLSLFLWFGVGLAGRAIAFY